MGQHKHENQGGLSIIDAVEVLSGVADMDLEKEGIAPQQIPQVELEGHRISSRSVEWLQFEDANTTMDRVKEIFHVVLNYLRHCYRQESHYFIDQKTLEGMKTIMVLVGEAAKKLDKFTEIFQGKEEKCITKLAEYRQLQDFYRKKIEKMERTIDASLLSKWILGLSGKVVSKPQKQTVQTKDVIADHVFVDLDTVKKDSEYELLFIRKEDGTRFYSPRLLRNLKLVVDFGGINEEGSKDPLSVLTHWQNKVCLSDAQNLLDSLGPLLGVFYQEALEYKDNELVEDINKALMALMLAGQSKHLVPTGLTYKSCTDYFSDFQRYLRHALNCRDYQKLLVYPPQENDDVRLSVLNIIHGLCEGLFLHLRGIQVMVPEIDHVLHASHKKKENKTVKFEGQDLGLSHQLAEDDAAIFRWLKQHPNGPLMKTMEILENGESLVFDPLMQNNLPNFWYDLHIEGKKSAHVRIPSPTRQSVIHKAIVTDEFKGFILNYAKEKKRHLLINLQDRTSWKDFARCQALESLPHTPEFHHLLETVTLAVDTEFYHQLPPYSNLNQADSFMDQFKQHLKDDNAGFFFSNSLKHALFPSFVDNVMKEIHHVFFESKNMLTKENRCDFITLFYLMLEMKLLDIYQPDSISFTCKDGVDIGETHSAFLFAFFKWMNQEILSEADREYLNLMLYGPSILIRERAISSQPFHRMLGAMRTVEFARQQLGFEGFVKRMHEAFGPLFKTPIMKGQVQTPALPGTSWEGENLLAA